VEVRVHRKQVGGFNRLEKYEFVNGKDDIQYYGKENSCLKPTIK
jgi:hypothetical protein